MTEPEPRKPKRQWLGLILTTVVGIAATIGVGWYQLSRAEQQATLAEEERVRNARQALVAIVEEHVLNDKPIEVPRLSRLIDQRRREDRVSTTISIAELLEQAEFNILGSRYLAFERKQQLKGVFDALYADLSTREFAPFPTDAPNADLLNALARQVQDGKTGEALQSIKRLQEAQSKDLQQARSATQTQSFTEVLRKVASDPTPILLVMAVYIALVVFMIRRPATIRAFRRLFLRRISPSEAEARIAYYVAKGMSDEAILTRLDRLGVPPRWAMRQVATARSAADVPAGAKGGASIPVETKQPPSNNAMEPSAPEQS